MNLIICIRVTKPTTTKWKSVVQVCEKSENENYNNIKKRNIVEKEENYNKGYATKKKSTRIIIIIIIKNKNNHGSRI